MQRQANDVALVAKALHPVHEPSHQEEPTPFLLREILLGRTVTRAGLEVEAWSFVDDLENQIFVADDGADAHLLSTGRVVTAQDGVRKRLRQSDGNVERAFCGGEPDLAAALPRELHYTFYVFYVARDLEIERDARFS